MDGDVLRVFGVLLRLCPETKTERYPFPYPEFRLVKLHVRDITHCKQILRRAMVMQQKTHQSSLNNTGMRHVLNCSLMTALES